MSQSVAVLTLEHVECAKCSMVFGVTEKFQRERRADHAAFFCPNGHSNYYPVKSEAEKLRDQLAGERARLDQERAETARLRRRVALRDRQVAARKAVATKLRKRIASGKCPCCHAKFKDLAQHMTVKHPHWNPEQAAEAIAARDTTS